MQENNFEKAVQQKMEELQFTPSAPVWQKVELQIRRKRERRRLLLLLLPLLIVGGGLTWYFVGYNRGVPSSDAIVQAEQPDKNKAVQKGAQPFSHDVERNENKQPESTTKPASLATGNKLQTAVKPLQKEKQTFSAQAPVTEKKADDKEEIKSLLPAIPKRKTNNLPQDLHAFVLEQEIKNIEAAPQQNTIENVSKSFWDSSKIEQTDIALSAKDFDSLSVKKDSIVTAAVAEDKADTTVIAAAQPVLVKKQVQKKKWSYTVLVRYGISGIRNQVMDVFSQERSSDYTSAPSSPLPSTGGGSSSGGNNSVPGTSRPLETSNGTAISLGAGVRRHLFKNTFIVAGLQYSQYTTRTNVGMFNRTDTMMSYNGRLSNISGYYRGGTATRYTARYHYIELPLALEYRLFKKLPLQVQHGISAGYLLSSNALYYNRTAGILYPSDEWLRKWGAQLFTSLDYRLLQTGHLQWFAGPQLQWCLTPLQHKVEPRRHHLFFAGLQTRITF